MLETVFEKIGTPYKEAEFGPRLALAKYWAEQCSPESLNKLLSYRNFEKFETLTAEQKKEIELLYAYLSGSEYTLEDLNTELYAIPGKVYTFADDKERKAAQGKFFKNVYELLIGKEKGPRLFYRR
jgi:lysyl-tRNA synthetase class 1